MSLFQKLRLGLLRSKTRSIEEQIDKVWQETESAKAQISEEGKGHEKRLHSRLDQKEISDLGEAEKALRKHPFKDENTLEDIKALSRTLSHLIGVSDDGKHVEKKLSLLQKLADAAKAIGPIKVLSKSAGQDGWGAGRSQKFMDEIIEDLRANRLLDA